MPRKDLAARRKYDRERIARLRAQAEAEQKRAAEHIRLADIERLGLPWNCSANDYGLALMVEQHQRDLALLHSGRLLRPVGVHSSDGAIQPPSGPSAPPRLSGLLRANEVSQPRPLAPCLSPCGCPAA